MKSVSSGSDQMASGADTGPAWSESERIARVILDHAAKISSETEIAALVRLNADLARDLIGADRCSLWLLDERTDELWTTVAHGTDEIRIKSGEGIVGACIARNETILVNDAASDPDFCRRVDDIVGYHTQSVACVPLRCQNRAIGAMQLLNKAGGFSTRDADLLQFMAMYAASAIQAERLRQEAEAGRLLRREIELAAEVQGKLLPQDLGNVEGLEYSGFYRPARIVGGDYFDFQLLSDHSFGLTLGDVSGKGFAAAVLMASIQTLLRNLMGRFPRELGQVVTSLNEAIHRICVPGRFSTLFCGTLNPQRDQLTYVNAGHIAPFIVRHTSGGIHRAAEGDIPVGLLASVVYQQHQISLFPGDLIACVSDGLFDVQNPKGELWEDMPVEKILEDNKARPIRQIAEALVKAIDTYAAGSEQFDDITIITVRVKTPSK